MSQVQKLVKPSASDVERVLEILLEAFAQDPIVSSHGGFDTDILADILRWRIEHGSPNWEIYVIRSEGREDVIQGVGLVKPPGHNFKDAPDEIMRRIKPEVQTWLQDQHYAAQKALDTKCFGEQGLIPTLYLCLLAVHSSARGKGLAPKILDGLKEVAEEANAPFSLNTEYDRLRLYYEKLGFETLGSIIMPITLDGQTIETWELVHRGK